MNEYLGRLSALKRASQELIGLLNVIGKARSIKELNSFEWDVFVILGANGHLKFSMKWLSDHFQKNYSTMTGVMDRLEKKSVIVRETNDSDRRVVAISLTKKWRRKYNEMAKRQERLAQITYDAITAERFDALLTVLQETNNCMSKRFGLVKKNDE